MDYRAWIERARVFVDQFRRRNPGLRAESSIAPPATPGQVAEAEAIIGRPLTRPLVRFLTEASGDCEFFYWWKPADDGRREAALSAFDAANIPGGLEGFMRLDCIAGDYSHCQELAEEGSWGDEPFCRDPLPIGSIGNGDYVAIDLASNAVVYLAHDNSSYRLADDFDTFLGSWEAICYLTFDIGPYERFLDKDGRGIVATEGSELSALRALLLPET